jgi:hypothetical protein
VPALDHEAAAITDPHAVQPGVVNRLVITAAHCLTVFLDSLNDRGAIRDFSNLAAHLFRNSETNQRLKILRNFHSENAV